MYLYFKYFLESKMAVDVLRLYNSLIRAGNRGPNTAYDYFDRIGHQEDVDSGGDTCTNSNGVIHDALLKLPAEIRAKISLANDKVFDETLAIDSASLESILRGILLE